MSLQSAKLNILADKDIPCVRQAFGEHGVVTTYEGPLIPPREISNADALLVRSTTRVTEDVLDGSRIRFVGTASAGADHIDAAALRRRGIAIASTPGSNAESVVEYVLAALLLLAARSGMSLRGRFLGVVGCGNIGSRLALRASALGLRVLKCDPFLAATDPDAYISLSDLLISSDIVTLHVPLTKDGPHPTFHLLDDHRLAQMHPGSWLLNTARGAVVDNTALLSFLRRGRIAAAVLDVWEGEPSPTRSLIDAATIATPHIAGHSHDGKTGGVIMLYNAFLRHFSLPRIWDPNSALAPVSDQQLRIRPPAKDLDGTAWLHAVTRQMYDLSADAARMRDLVHVPADRMASRFRSLRRLYPRRRTFRLHTLDAADIPGHLYTPLAEALSITVRA